MDLSGNEVSDLDDIYFFCEKPQLEVDAAFRPGIDFLFSPTTFQGQEMGRSMDKPILLDKEEELVNSPTITPVSVRPKRPQPCCDFEHLEVKLKMFLHMFAEFCFSKSYCVCTLMKNVVKTNHFNKTFS